MVSALDFGSSGPGSRRGTFTSPLSSRNTPSRFMVRKPG